MKFPSRIAGIPCQIEVTQYSPELPLIITGSGYGDCLPPEEECFEFIVLDRNNRPALWLERKLTSTDTRRIKEEFKANLIAIKELQEEDWEAA